MVWCLLAKGTEQLYYYVVTSHHARYDGFKCCSPLNGRAVLGEGQYGNATEGYWLTNVQCSGTETDITNCPRSPWGDDEGCDVTEPAAVSCLPDTATPPPRMTSSCYHVTFAETA